ncbi:MULTISPECIES: hypothetical protein [unclassified Pseudomonas]|uniref:hypothetical protein n=1 Tax=unclassified Pseudomonas TaxID=196821 RepID=UPI001484F6BE|nr:MULTISPECIES: hypothetical protein [unclassified Pseudomonas]
MNGVQTRRRFMTIFVRKNEPARSIKSIVKSIDGLAAILSDISRLLESKIQPANGELLEHDEKRSGRGSVGADVVSDHEDAFSLHRGHAVLFAICIGFVIGPILGYLSYGSSACEAVGAD